MNETFVNRLLSNSCPHDVQDDIYTFYIESHCVGWWIRARLVNTREPWGEWHVLEMVAVAGEGDTYPWPMSYESDTL